MATKQTRTYWKNYNLNYYDEQLNSGFKAGLWADCPLLAVQADPSIGYALIEDFMDFQAITSADPCTVDGYTTAQAASSNGTIAISSAAQGGVLLLDSESTTQHHGVTMHKNDTLFKCAADKDLWFEARFKIADTAGKCQMFVGLSKIDTALIASGDLDNTNNDYIGVAMEASAAGSLSFYACKDGTEQSDTATTLTTGAYVRVGFKVLGTDTIKAYVNDEEVTLSSVTSAVIPTTDALAPMFICQSDGTNDPIMHLDFYKVVQLR